MRSFPLLLLAAILLLPIAVAAQTRDGARRAESARYLNDLHADLKRSYYDKSFRGVDIEVAYDSARARLDRAMTDQERYRAIDRFLEPLNDSHTFFVAPRRIGLSDYSFGIRFYGDAAFIVRVDPATNADSVGLRLGDRTPEPSIGSRGPHSDGWCRCVATAAARSRRLPR
jgi:hypothetical protein